MREIKFRAWDKCNLKMFYGQSGFHFEGDGCVYLNVIQADFGADKNPVIMQFTGMVDRNKKEVYEGDIVTVLQTDEETLIRRHEVRFFRGRWVYQQLYGNYKIEELGSMFSFCPTSCYNRGLKVIGNIYENPELVKEEL